MLKHIKELRPLFARFGADTISEALSQEIHGDTPDRVLRGNEQQHVKGRTLTANLRAAKRSFVLHKADDTSVPDYHLPLLTVNDGNVLLDGVAQHRAAIDKDNKTVRWTRAIPGHGYEHGRMHVFNHGFAGNGAVLLSKDAQLADSSQDDSQIIRFHAAKPNANLDGVTKPANNRNHAQVAKFLKAQHIAMQNGPTKTTSSVAAKVAPPRFDMPRPASAISNFVNIPGLKVNAAVANPAIAVPGDYIDNEDIWDLSMDKGIWEAKKPIPSINPATTVSMGQVSFSTYHSGGSNGIPVPILTMPLLDQLCSTINAKHLANQPQLNSLYSSHVEITKNGTQMGVILLDAASLLYQLADKPDGKDEVTSLMNVTFKASLGSDIVMPLLFRTLSLEISANFGAIRGAALEYDNDHRGADGQR